MQVKLWDIKNGNVIISEHCFTNWYLKDIIDRYGNAVAVKIFTVLQYMSDLNPETNPYSEIREDEKLEFIVRNVCPELPLEVDWDDDVIQEAILSVKQMYETKTYRTYLASKKLIDKLTSELETVNVSLRKEDGNIGEINKAYVTFETLREGAKKAFAEFEKENNMVQTRGKGSTIRKKNGGKEEELD